MKKIIAFLTATVMLLCLSITTFATAVSEREAESNESTYENAIKNEYDVLAENAIILDISFSADFKKIDIHGNISHDVLTTYDKYSLEILRIKPYETVEDEIFSENPNIVASMNIAARFDFTISVQSSIDLFSKYAVVFRSEEKKPVLATDPQYVNITTERQPEDSGKLNYKGSSLTNFSDISVSGDMGFGTVIIPVYFDRLINKNSKGYMYPFENTYCYFDTAYIDELDNKVKIHSMSGAKVYFQLLLPSSLVYTQEGNPQYYMPDVYDEDTIARISTYVKFLADRYDTFTKGELGGFIVGRKIDIANYNYCGDLDISDYAQRYAYYLGIVANSARIENKNLDIVIPLSDRDTFTNNVNITGGDYPSSDLLKRIIIALSNNYKTRFDYNILIESDKMPITIASNEKNEDYFISLNNDGYVGINNLYVIENYLHNMKKSYQSVPNNILYLWQVPSGTSGNTFKCSYAYSYYSLLLHSKISSFVVDLSECAPYIFEECGNLIKYIDTNDGIKETDKLLSFFNTDSWAKVVEGFSTQNISFRTLLSSGKISPDNSLLKGSFSYHDFSMGHIGEWNNGAYGKNIKVDYSNDGKRALRQVVSKTAGVAHSDLYYLYEFDENFAFTPTLRFDVGITDPTNSKGQLYEITVTMGKGNSSVSESYVVRSGEISQLWFNIGDFSELNKIGYIKISSRSITGSNDEYSIWLHDMLGFSEKYNSEELNMIISSERSQIRNQINSSDSNRLENTVYWIVFAIILIAITIGGSMFFVTRRDDIASTKYDK